MKKKALAAVLAAVLLYTRLVGLDWGLPYPLHPDERNMAVAIQGLRCDTGLNASCLNPHFFAYGQLPLYLAYFGVQGYHLATGIHAAISYDEATLALRLIAALASVATVFVLLHLTALAFFPHHRKEHGKAHPAGFLPEAMPLPVLAGACLLFIFAPYAIQMSHFGTTESLLMLFYPLIVYLAARYLEEPEAKRIIVFLALASGAAVATKVSSLIFLAVPAGVFLWKKYRQPPHLLRDAFLFALVFIPAAILLSPQNLISYPEFSASLAYESSIGLGTYIAFYTRQFIGTVPVLFQVRKIFPYALGWTGFILGAAGLFLLPRKNKTLNVIRFAFLMYFLPTALIFAKWTRFMAPVFPLMSLLAAGLLVRIYQLRLRRLMIAALLLVSLLPGMAYVTVYQNEDIRFTASRWIYSHVPGGSKILSETANVIDIPVPPPGDQGKEPTYRLVPFDFYSLDADPQTEAQLAQFVTQADYIIVPTRRVFANHPAGVFPKTAKYYEDLFAGRLGFEEVAEFANPYIGKTDENAEETWSVFDHPVVRIYKRNPNLTPHDAGADLEKLKSYAQTTFDLEGHTYRLLVADTPEKQEQGLMFVRSKKDIGGLDGMIFIFEGENTRYFWNKNTVSDLDLYWIRGNTVAGSTALPSVEKSKTVITVSSPVPVDTVIEIVK